MMSPPVITGAAVWLVSQVVMIIIMIRHKPRNRKVEEAVRRGVQIRFLTCHAEPDSLTVTTGDD